MTLNIKQKMGNSKVVILVMPNEKYSEYMIDLVKELSLAHEQTCFVTLNRPYAALARTFKEKKIDANKFFFIDGITRAAREEAETIQNCKFLSSPNALTEMGLKITDTLKKSDSFIFDSLSTLLIYENVPTVMKFVHSLISRIRVYECPAIFTALQGDAETQLIKDVTTFVDKVIRL